MDAIIRPGSRVEGKTTVPGDKSIAHRWILLSSIASGSSTLSGLPAALDVASSAHVFGRLGGCEALLAWAREARVQHEAESSTWDGSQAWNYKHEVHVEGEGFEGLKETGDAADCGNSGTTMRLSMGLLAGVPVSQVLAGDASLSVRPMERVAGPLRAMGASVTTVDGHAPVTVTGGSISGITYELPVPSAQVKSAVLLAGLRAEGATTVVDPAATRDHTERALAALGCSVQIDGPRVTVHASEPQAFDGQVPGDPSSAAFILGAAAITGGAVTAHGVGLNPSRIHFLDALRAMGSRVTVETLGTSVGEPWGDIAVAPTDALGSIQVDAAGAALMIDEIPLLACLATRAEGTSRFHGLAELRHKESDRLLGIVDGIRGLGGTARIEEDDLVVEGRELTGGSADPLGDHRLAMAFTVAASAATGESRIADIECSAVSFPGFAGALRDLGIMLEPA